jgi:hypothetical protein
MNKIRDSGGCPKPADHSRVTNSWGTSDSRSVLDEASRPISISETDHLFTKQLLCQLFEGWPSSPSNSGWCRRTHKLRGWRPPTWTSAGQRARR